MLRRIPFRRPAFVTGARADDSAGEIDPAELSLEATGHPHDDHSLAAVAERAIPESGDSAPRGRRRRKSIAIAETAAEAVLDADTETYAIAEAGEGETGEARRFHLTKKRVALGVGALFVVMLGGLYTQKEKISPQFADASRNIIGDERTAQIESYYFTLQDKMDKVKYRIFGGTTNPFKNDEVTVSFVKRPEPRTVVYFADTGVRATQAVLTADTLGPAPMQLPKTTALRETPEPGEGVWTTTGLPHSTPNDILMAKTFIRPDKTRPYALVGVLLLDSRRVRLGMVAGTEDPGGFRGAKGSGVLPTGTQSSLLVAWNGGFKGPHGNYGMYSDGRDLVPLRDGLASIAVYADGSVKMGEWGRDLTREDTMVGVRQNAVLLVDHGEVSKRVNEGNDTWGYVNVNSSEFITWRSAVGLTKDGNLLIAAGNSLSAATLAQALWAAGAYTAMQLDINTPYVLISTYFSQPDGSLRAERFMETMSDAPSRFLKGGQTRDFMYVTLDETRYRN